MCGIAGILVRGNGLNTERLLQSIPAMKHRGPDATGHWINPEKTIGFTHTRLSIIDPGHRSDQPMILLERYIIVYNGEIYNYRELAKSISSKEGYIFQTGSDTEVLVVAFHFYGEKCLEILEGMFAFSIWDMEKQELFCARDRLGEKPFYYFYEEAKGFIFSNEIRAIHSMGISREVNHRLLLHYLTIGVTNIPGDPTATFFTNIHKLEPGHSLNYNLRTGTLSRKSYWKCPAQIRKISKQEAYEKFERLLSRSVTQRSYAHTSVGSSLSGGLDSSSILYFLKKAGMNPSCFSAVFPGQDIDETPYIKALQNELGLSISFVSPSADELVADLDSMIHAHNHPIANPSSYAQFCVYRQAGQQGVKVLLDGQGADETLAGYSKYNHWIVQENLRKHGPIKAYKTLGELKNNEQRVEFNYQNILSSFFPTLTKTALENRYNKNVTGTDFIEPDYLFKNLLKKDICKPVVRTLNDILYHDTFIFGLEELLRYADLNSMAHGVEVRLPFLSTELIEFAFSLPSEFKIHKGFSKWILRKTMENKLPGEITWRKRKIGFEVPVKTWIDHPALKQELQRSISILSSNGILKSNSNNFGENSYDPLQKWRFLVAGKLL